MSLLSGPHSQSSGLQMSYTSPPSGVVFEEHKARIMESGQIYTTSSHSTDSYKFWGLVNIWSIPSTKASPELPLENLTLPHGIKP